MNSFCFPAGVDYDAVVSETITISGGNTFGFRQIPLAADSIGENDEVFRATLTNPSSNAMLGERDVAMVTITDATNVRVQFSPNTHMENEDIGSIPFTIVKLDQSERPVSVNFNTAPGSAFGKDHFPSSYSINYSV